MKNKTGLILLIFGSVLLFGAVLLSLNLYLQNRTAERNSEIVLEKLTGVIAESTDTSDDSVDGAYTQGFTVPPADASVYAETGNGTIKNDSDANEMHVVRIDDNYYIGYLKIPVIKLDLPVMSDWDYEKMTIAPCRQYGSVYTDDLVIAGHNYRSHFGSLSKLSPGDEVFFTDTEGVEREYIVAEIETLNPYQIKEMKESPWELTLYTCTLDGRQRITVRCEMINSFAK